MKLMKQQTVFVNDNVRINVRKHVVRNACEVSQTFKDDVVQIVTEGTDHPVWSATWDRIWNPLPNTREIVGPSRENIWWRMWDYDYPVEQAYEVISGHLTCGIINSNRIV